MNLKIIEWIYVTYNWSTLVYTWNYHKIANNCIPINIKKNYGYQRGNVGKKDKLESGITIYTPIYIYIYIRILSKDLWYTIPYGRENSIQYSVIIYMWKTEKICVCIYKAICLCNHIHIYMCVCVYIYIYIYIYMTKSLCCMPKTNTIL